VGVDRLDFAARIAELGGTYERATGVEQLMLNVGRRCDLECSHCHHACSPSATEAMSESTMRASIALADRLRPRMVDVTGGAPELWPHIRVLVDGLSDASIPVRVRTNLVSLAGPSARGLAKFFADSGVTLLASLPGTTSEQVRAQRGESYAESVELLRELSDLGYGRPDGPRLDIAWNPPLGELPRDETCLTEEFSRHFSAMGVSIGRVRAIANVPVGRFGEALESRGGYASYVHRLADAFNPETVAALWCRSGINVAWDGRLYDCDFNLAARLPACGGSPTVIDALAHPEMLAGRRLMFGAHCFACTASAGSG